ncbi:MAG TPA: class I SAM-dependent methyltransferase [Ignavibacteriaceae bacterium]
MKLIPGEGWLPCDLPSQEKKARIPERNEMTCSLCGGVELIKMKPPRDKRFYFRCEKCSLIFVPEIFFPSRKAEKSRYLEHYNSIEDSGYVNFLNRAISPALKYLNPEMIGLDYGCGYEPVLSQLLRRQHIECDNYDPLFGFKPSRGNYDFVFSTECFEHFHQPSLEIDNIIKLLNPGGYLCIMTERWETLERFNTWYYKRDPTHVSFFHLKTFEYIIQSFGLVEMYRDRNRIIILKKLEGMDEVVRWEGKWPEDYFSKI